jgi:hypothetical protein
MCLSHAVNQMRMVLSHFSVGWIISTDSSNSGRDTYHLTAGDGARILITAKATSPAS